MRNRFDPRTFAVALIAPTLLVVAWQLAVSHRVFPAAQSASPIDVIVRLWGLLTPQELLKDARCSLVRLIVGVLIGTLAGVLTSLIIANSRTLDRLFSPTIQLCAGIPVVVWIPFWVMVFGVAEAFKISMVAISTYFLVQFHTSQALKSVTRSNMELADIYEKSKWEKVRHILLPSARPAILTSVRTAFAFGWVVIFFVEYASAREGTEGLGWFIANARELGKVEEEFAGLLLLALIAFLSDKLLAMIQRRMLAWSDTLETSTSQEKS